MASQLFLNNFEVQFIDAVKDAATTGTPATELNYGVLRLNNSASGVLVNPTGGDYYLLTSYKRSGSVETNIEIMRVTAVDIVTYPGECRITVSRAQEGTLAQAYVTGDYIGLRLTKGGAENLLQTTQLKTINTNSLVGSGDVAVQATLVSGSNIKTINGASILGSGNLVASTDLTAPGPIGGTTPSTAVFTSINGGPLAGFRNRIINGGCQIAQRAVAPLTATPAYGGVDRFLFSNSGTGITSTSTKSSNAAFASGFCMQLNGSWTSGGTTVKQRIEASSCKDFYPSGTMITLSARIYHTFGSATNFTLTLNKATALDTFSGVTQIGSAVTTSVASGAVTNISGTWTLAAGDSSNGLEIVISHASNTASSALLLIGDVQLEPGSVATPFEFRPYSVESALCQRYLPAVSGGGYMASGHVTSATTGFATFIFLVTPRVLPTGVTTTGTASDYRVWNGAGSYITCSAVPSFYTTSLRGATLNFAVASGATAGRATDLNGVHTNSKLLFDGCEP